MLLLTGEPGIGKTRLLQAAAQQALAHGWCVLFGGCSRRGGLDPYTPILEVLSGYLEHAEPSGLAADLSGCEWLARLLPEAEAVLHRPPDVVLAARQERRLIFAAVARFLQNVAGPAGTLLVLDDLQWADPDALDLLSSLMRGNDWLRLVGAYRDTEVRPADPLGLMLADLARAGLVQRHELEPLAPDEAAALLDGLLGGVATRDQALAQRVLERAEGVPFFLVSFAQALRMGSRSPVPWDLAQGVRQRLALLPETAHHALTAAAILGRQAPRALLRVVAAQHEEELVEALEAACRAQLLVEEDEATYTFPHDVIRDVVETDLGSARRAVLHRRAAQALAEESAGSSPELVATIFCAATSRPRRCPTWSGVATMPGNAVRRALPRSVTARWWTV